MVPRLSLPATIRCSSTVCIKNDSHCPSTAETSSFPSAMSWSISGLCPMVPIMMDWGVGESLWVNCGVAPETLRISFARSPAARITPSQSSGKTQRVVAFPAAAMQKASDDFSYRTYWGSVLSRSVFTGLSLLPVHPAVKKMLRIKKKLFHCLM